MAMPRYWLFKSEPGAYSFDDLVNDGVAQWDGVRNFQARNLLRDEIKEGDGILFYHSTAKPMAVIGTAEVVREGYPDATAADPMSLHPDPKHTADKPIWYMVDIRARERFSRAVTLDIIKATPALGGMMLVRRGARLSVQPVSEAEWEFIREMGEPQPLS